MEFYGLLGEKLSHSLSPTIHKQIFDLIEREGAYKLFEVEKEKLENFVDALKVLKIKGSNVTIPYKKDIMKYLDEISDEAKKIGSVNTISLKNDKLYGYNTDYHGFGYMLEINNVILKDKVAVILGNGGATKAVVHYLLDKEVSKIYIVSRRKESDEFNLKGVSIISYDDLNSIKGDIIINSTPVGMYPNVESSPVSKDVIRNFDTVVDLIYNPLETVFLKIGKELDKKTIGGLYMLVAQAVKAQEIWQDTDIKEDVIRKIYEELESRF